MKTYRVAILGCRGRGGAAARAYFQHPRTQLVGLCDLLPERLEALGAEVEVAEDARYTDLDAMIGETQPDIVAIPTGTEFHYDLSMRVLAHGVHIDVEKPLCTALDEADRVIARAGEQGVQIAVHHQGRTGGAMEAVARALEEGRIGQVRYLSGSGKGYYGGYGLMNIGTHMLNNMLRVAGPVRSVAATLLTDGRPVEPGDVLPSPSGMGYIAGEHITASLDFADGCTGTLLQHRFPQMDTTAYGLEIIGTEGRLWWRSGGAWYLPAAHFAPGEEAQWEPLEMVHPDSWDPAGPAAEADFGFVDEYVRALDQGRAHQCNGAEGRHIMEIMMAIFESGAYGRRVYLPQAERGHPLLRWRQEAGLGVPAEMPRAYGEWLQAEDGRLGR
ncbi:MAG: hypothetical protein GKR89_27265 [Candidatus Latescibacteria bacterium]|nr:hypothetical protein [Candidatus Latescibacterota bacterium]